MKHNFLLHYGEIALKGKNRKCFEDILVANIRLIAKRENVKAKVVRLWGRITAETDNRDGKNSCACQDGCFRQS